MAHNTDEFFDGSEYWRLTWADGRMYLESITTLSRERGLSWAYACEVPVPMTAEYARTMYLECMSAYHRNHQTER